MIVSLVANSRLYRYASVLMAAATAYAPSASGVNAIFTSLGEAVRQIQRLPNGHYTTEPTAPFLGVHPGRDPGRGIWKTKPGSSGGGGHSVALSLLQGPHHTLAVAASAGPPFSWEGGSPSEAGDLNTGNGNLLTALRLVNWKSRGLNIDFTLYHNSESNYSDELGGGWTWTYDIYINNIATTPTVHWGTGLSIPFSLSGGGGGGAGEELVQELTHGPNVNAFSGTTYYPPSGIYDQLVENSDSTWTLTKKNGTQYKFNTAGFCTAIVDTNGNTISLSLNSANYCTRVTDPTGKYLTINLSGSNKFTSIVDPLGRTWSFTQSGGELTSVAWPSLGGSIYSDSYTYNSLNDILTHTDKRGNVWSDTYNSDGSVASISDPLSHTTSYSYSSSATTITDPLSHVRTDNYSGGVLTSSVDESGYSESFTSRDSNFNPLTIVDKNGKSWNFTWDSLGNILSKKDPLSHQWTWTNNALSEPLTETDPLGNGTQVTYSSTGNLLTVTDPLGHVVQTNTYDSYGDILSTTDAMSNATDFTWDTYGNLATIEDPLGNTTSIGVDGLNRRINRTDPLSHEEQKSYDAWGRVVTRTHPDSTLISESWDNENDRIGLTDENTRSTTYSFDAAKRLISSTNARSDSESYGYDNANRRTSVTDGNGHVRNYTYTNRGEMATLTMADSSEEQWAYDGNGNATAHVNPLSQTIDYLYDSADRKTGIDYPTGTDTSFSFDNANRLTSMADSTGTTSYSYDNSSRVTGLTTPQGNMSYTYDNAGKRLTMVEGVGTTSYTYDADSRVASEANPYSETTSFVYDAASRMTKKTFGSGAYDVRGYDPRDRVTSINHDNSSGTVLSSESYTLDPVSNLTSKTVDSLTTSYTYDNVNQLLSESNGGYSASYTYDDNGNRATQILNGTSYSYAYDSGDKLNSVSVGGAAVKTYGYDAAGRTTSVTSSAGTTNLSYDYEDRITGITFPSSATNAFSYNGASTRVGKVDSTGTYTFKRDGADVTDPVLSDGSIAYTPGTSERKSGVSTFDHSNYLCSTTRQTNASQSTTGTRVDDAFGNLISTTGTPQSPFGFAGGVGYEEDHDSGLKLLGHRYYDPTSGRFLVRDQSKDGRNWFAYCANNPTGYVDSLGAEPQSTGPHFVTTTDDSGEVGVGGSGGSADDGEGSDWGDGLRRFAGHAGLVFAVAICGVIIAGSAPLTVPGALLFGAIALFAAKDASYIDDLNPHGKPDHGIDPWGAGGDAFGGGLGLGMGSGWGGGVPIVSKAPLQ